MQLIVGVAGLVTEVKQLKSQSFSKDDQHHESLLSEVSIDFLAYWYGDPIRRELICIEKNYIPIE